MSFLNWGAALDLGVKSMNDEHKVLIDIMNRLYDRNKAGAPKSELEKIIIDLANYTTKHFADEEAYMASIQFPELTTHKIIHQNLLRSFGEQVDKFKAGDGKVSDGFFSFLKLWLTAHIQGIDMKYGTFSKGVKKAA